MTETNDRSEQRDRVHRLIETMDDVQLKLALMWLGNVLDCEDEGE